MLEPKRPAVEQRSGPAAPEESILGGALKRTFDSTDRFIILILAIVVLFSTIIFFIFISSQNLLHFPEDRLSETISSGGFEYFAFALEYRERRLALALSFRTFMTTFGFAIGLILASIGGIFILRMATVDFSAHGNIGQGGEEAFPKNSKAAFALATNSPGVLFMVGGVLVIFGTQYFAIPVGSPEIYPANAAVRCDPSQEARGECYINNSASPSDTQFQRLAGYCRRQPQDDICAQIQQRFP